MKTRRISDITPLGPLHTFDVSMLGSSHLFVVQGGIITHNTGDRSEELLGYFTKFGDGGVDFLPISHLYKTQVRRLGAHLGLPKNIVEKPASPQLWPGHKATDEIPAVYDRLDILLHHLFDLKASPHEAAFSAGLPVRVADKVLEMHRKTEHKRTMPPSLSSI